VPVAAAMKLFRLEPIAAATPQKSKLLFFEVFKDQGHPQKAEESFEKMVREKRSNVPKTPEIEASHAGCKREISARRTSDAIAVSMWNPPRRSSRAAGEDGAGEPNFVLTQSKRSGCTSASGRLSLFVCRESFNSTASNRCSSSRFSSIIVIDDLQDSF
jgi:hypothetical protein